MRLNGAVALVTGANRGIGAAFAQALLDHGAAKVYAGARRPETITDPRLTPLRLDVTDPESVAAAVRAAGDVDIVVNNAGIGSGPDLSLDAARAVMEVNYLGTLEVTRAFAPVLARNGGGALVNMLSVASWWAMEIAPTYAASKAAQWSLTNATRMLLAKQGTLVVGVHCGFVDTDLVSGVDAPKISPEAVADQTMRALLDDAEEVLADDFTKTTRAALSGDINTMQRIPV